MFFTDGLHVSWWLARARCVWGPMPHAIWFGSLVMVWFTCLMLKPLIKKTANGMLAKHENTHGLH